jgi:hypothetical protein
MDANERVIAQLERLYSLYGAGDQVDAVVSIGGHAYRTDIRHAAYWFINTRLKGDPRPVTDGDVDVVEDPPAKVIHPIETQKLRVFLTDSDIPEDQLNTTIDEHFVPIAHVVPPAREGLDEWREKLVGELRRVVFRTLPERVRPARVIEHESPQVARLETEEGIFVRLENLGGPAGGAEPKRILLYVQTAAKDAAIPGWIDTFRQTSDRLYRCDPRGTGETRWTSRNPPNYVARSHVLLGRTVDTGRVFDVIAAARHLREIYKDIPVCAVGEGGGAILAAYAAVLEPDIAGAVAHQPPLTHMDPAAPQFLNVLRVADVPELMGLVAPRPLTIVSSDERLQRTAAVYGAADAADKLTVRKE